MKRRFLILVLCLLLVSILTLPALAAGSAQMNISAGSSTVYRGDTVAFTVSLSKVTDCKAGGIEVSYDSSVFEWVSGECLAAGAFMKDFSGGSGAFSYSDGTDLSGNIFRFTLRVKSTAPFGSTTISGSPSIRDTNGAISCSVSGASVNIACKHSFHSCERVDGSTHKLTCEHCKETKTESHSYTSKVNKPATCKEAGSETLTCTGCGDSKTQTIPKTNTHSYGSWTKVSDSTHKHSCSVCGKEETTSHSWNSGTVTKAATCIATGTRVRTCTGCKTTKTETIPKSSQHPYTDWARVDENTHTHSCPVCGKEETAAHRFDAWNHDEANHYKLCTGCGERSEQAAHTPGPAPTETSDQVCTVCQRVLAPSTAHEHVFGTEWITDESYHWHGCTQCEEKQGLSIHVYTDDCDTDCDVCGAVRQAPHAPEEAWSADEAAHWYNCTACGAQLQHGAHTPGPEATLQQAQTCTECAYALSPKLTHDTHDFSAQHSHVCECGETHTAGADCEICEEARGTFPWWWIVIAAEALILGGVIVYLLFKKRYVPVF